MRARLALLLLTAGLWLPGTARAQAVGDFGASAAMHNPAPAGPASASPAPPNYGSNNPAVATTSAAAVPATSIGVQPSPVATTSPGSGNGSGGTPPSPAGNPDQQTVYQQQGTTGGIGVAITRQAFGSGPEGLAQAEAAQATFLAMTQFTQTLLDFGIDGRGFGPAGFDAELAAYSSLGNDRTHGGIGREAYEAIYGKPSLVAAQWNIWSAGFGGSQVSTSGSGSVSRSFATVAGADYSLSPQTRMGFALAGGGTGFANNFASGQSALFQAGAFVRHTVGPAYVSTALAYGWQAITNEHPVTSAGTDQLNTALNAIAYAGRVESGYRLAMPWLGISPYAAAEVTTFRLPGTAATAAYGTTAAAPGDSIVTDSRAELGLRASTSLVLARSVMNLRGRLAWAHDFSAAQSLPTAFQSLPGQSLVPGSTALAPNAALAGLALELRGMDGWFAAASFDSALSSQVRSYSGKAALRYAW